MTRPKLLDLYCCRGCASVGYHRAGFDVTGIDIDPTCADFYPYELHIGDAIEYAKAHAHEYDAIHASPPCQASTTMSNRWRGKGGKADSWVNLIAPTREALDATGLPYVIENVPGARKSLHDPATLHGGMFDLGVARPRLFEANFPIEVDYAPQVKNPLGVYGKAPDGRRLFTRADGTEQRAASSVEEAKTAMGVDWPIDWTGVREAIPPAYTEYLGRQLLAHLNLEAAA